MNRPKRYILSLILVIIMLSIPMLVVFAKELGLLTISGPGIKGELALKDQKVIMTLEQSGFFDQTAFIQPPKNLNMAAGYTITANINLDGQVLPFVQMVYYAADQGQPGYVHYTGRLDGQTLQTVDQWQRLTPNADNAFRGLMSSHNVALQPALVTVPAAAPAVTLQEAPPVAPAISLVPMPTSYIISAVVAAILLLTGAGLVLRRRAMSHTTS
ncbi:MAG TPA: hypothetical protein VK206_10245 [Anaerolineales bacterium]|nr:hypothetical protein [Anaerolineales bacterium]